MAHMVTVTIAGGAYLGPKDNTPLTINADRIMDIRDAREKEVGTSVIKMDDNHHHWVTETQAQLKALINA